MPLPSEDGERGRGGPMQGLVLRSQLLVLLQNKVRRSLSAGTLRWKALRGSSEFVPQELHSKIIDDSIMRPIAVELMPVLLPFVWDEESEMKTERESAMALPSCVSCGKWAQHEELQCHG